AAVPADCIEAADHVPAEQRGKLAALLESLDDEMRCASRIGRAYRHERRRDTPRGMERRPKLIHRPNHVRAPFGKDFQKGNVTRQAEEGTTREGQGSGIP